MKKRRLAAEFAAHIFSPYQKPARRIRIALAACDCAARRSNRAAILALSASSRLASAILACA